MLRLLYLVLGLVNCHSMYRLLKSETHLKEKFREHGLPPPWSKPELIRNTLLKIFVAFTIAWMFFFAIRGFEREKSEVEVSVQS